jgi:hypothetical protein
MRPWPKCSPFRNIIGTAMIWRASTSSWNRPPSMVVTLMRGLITDISVQRLHHVRAVMAGQRDIGFEA